MTTYKGNIGYLFNHLYYQNTENQILNFDNLKANTSFFNSKNHEIINYKYTKFDYTTFGKTLKLKTTYPGLVVGLGYAHGIKAEGEFKLGFSFDYTSGLPIIQGSTVKGMLRSKFPNRKLHKKTDEVIKSSKEEYILWILKDIVKIHSVDKINVDLLEKEIFDGYVGTSEKFPTGYLPVSSRDTFFDATIISANSKKLIFGDDSITPHGTNPLKNPIPLLFLKILPEVVFQFDFELHDGIITKEQKMALFNQILLDFGIGAKTNVGYGQLTSV